MKIIYRKDSEFRKTLFIDRDGTINRDCPYCHRIEDLFIYEDAVEFMKRYADAGYRILIITNQSGINRGYFTLQEFISFNNNLVSRLLDLGVEVSATYFCPHRPDENCSCRKPGTGLIEEAKADFAIDMDHSLMAGDRDDIDGLLASRIGIPFILLNH